MPTISEAMPADIPQLVALLGELFAQEVEFQPEPARQAEGLRQIINHPERGRILVLREGTEVIGTVCLLFTISTALGGRVALLEDLIVHAEARAAGAGSRLIDAAIKLARELGCLRITLLTDHSNEKAQQFYRRRGFAVSTMVTMRVALTPE